MTYVIRVESQWVRCSLRSTPEWLTGTRHGVLRKAEKELSNVVIVIPFELQARPGDTLVKCQRFIGNEEASKLFDLLLLLTRVFEIALKVVRLR